MLFRCETLADKVKKETELGEKALEKLRILKVVISGPPNVGKSTLMNFITAEDLSIISCWEGTTRDTIKGEITVSGHRLEILDTAGIRKTDEPIEKMGINRSL